jgi:hypothetical protein
MSEPFVIRDCALIAIATGQSAQTLAGMRDKLEIVPESSIYYHFWGGLLRSRFDDPEYQNDFAVWARHALHDKTLAERLALVNPTDYPDMEVLRRELMDIIEERVDEGESIAWNRALHSFFFLRSQIVIFGTRRIVTTPEELGECIPHMSLGSIFYHFIDARRRTHLSRDDFTQWVSGFGDRYYLLTERISHIDPYFITLMELRDELIHAFRQNAPEEEVL